MPGRTFVSAAIFETSSSWVLAFVHSPLGLREMKTSESSRPIGSVATSAVPVLVQMSSISSENFFLR
jgi:hypothetical protein